MVAVEQDYWEQDSDLYSRPKAGIEDRCESASEGDQRIRCCRSSYRRAQLQTWPGHRARQRRGRLGKSEIRAVSLVNYNHVHFRLSTAALDGSQNRFLCLQQQSGALAQAQVLNWYIY